MLLPEQPAVRRALLCAASFAALLVAVTLAGCGGGNPHCVTISPSGSKMCGKDALVFCRELGGDRVKRTAKDCAAIEKERRTEEVRVFFCTNLSCRAQARPIQIERVRVKLKMNPLVESVKYISKAEAFAEMKSEHPDLTKGLQGNPLPDALTATVEAGKGAAVARTLSPKPPGVERVTFSR